MWVILIKIRDDHSISFRAIFEIPLTCLTMKPHWVSLGESNETQWEPSEVLQAITTQTGCQKVKAGLRREAGKRQMEDKTTCHKGCLP